MDERSTYQFTLIVDGPDLQDQSFIDLLFEAGCDDATVGVSDGVQYVDFDREAGALDDAILSAVDDLETLKGVEVVRIADAGLASLADVAARVGRTRESVRLLVSGDRGPGGFPKPVTDPRSRYRLWRWSEVAHWFNARYGGTAPVADHECTAFYNAALECRYGRRRRDSSDRVTLRELVGMRLSRSPDRMLRSTSSAGDGWDAGTPAPPLIPPEADDTRSFECLFDESQWLQIMRVVGDSGYTIFRTRLADVINPGLPYNDLRRIRCPDQHRGVYAFRDPSGPGEFLYVGKSDKGDKARDIKVRIGQHLSPKDTGGNLRRNWCRQNCSHRECGDKSRCLGPEFCSFEDRVLRCDVWTITWPPGEIDTETVTRVEDVLVRLAKPAYQT
ncbi:MAG: hypothetical protein OXI95_14535 [bacterium]|nr:hypothetical protein [bacterium]